PAFAQSSASVVKARGYLSVDSARPGDKFKIAVAVEVDPGYHINAHKPSLDYLHPTTLEFAPAAGIRFTDPNYPQPKLARFEFAPETELAVHEGIIYITADAEADQSIAQGATAIRATVSVQSCNDTQCLAPADINVEIPLKVIAAGQTIKDINSEIFSKAASLTVFGGEQDTFAQKIAQQGIVLTLVGIFLAGLALNLTPCVYPIIPITIGFFINQSAREGAPRLRRTFLMASMYVLGMAVTYSALGVFASLTKGLFGGALQNPIVLIALAAVMVALALSMFGLYEFRVPEFLNRFANESSQSAGGVAGSLVMGLTMGIVAAPCIGPFVLGLLVHVGAKGDPFYGFLLFFVLALGLGLPYLLLGTFSGAIKSLPRSGQWMVGVRKVFGVVLVGMALYFLMPLMGRYTNYIFVAFFALSALYLVFYESLRTKLAAFAWTLRVIGAGAIVLAVFFALPEKTEAGIAWQPYSEQALAEARAEGRGVIIDSFADWCVPCKELDKFTFTDTEVKQEAERFVRLKLDLTTGDANSEAGRAKERFGILGVPTVIFLGGDGQEVRSLRLEGFEKPAPFVERLKKIEFTPREVEKANVETEMNAPAPSVSFELVGGGKLDLTSLGGKVVLVDFWATWCIPCISEIPTFNQLDKEYKKKGLEIVAVSLDEEGAAKVKPFLKKYPTTYTQTLGNRDIASRFSVEDSSLPVAILIDKQGRIRFRHVGRKEKEVFETGIKQLLAE
ncbi:MAG: cytochrome c biogenesis protein CcdA, partial [Acidobacteriota bacterium]